MTVLAAINVEAVVIFAIVLGVTLGITYWASKRASSAVGFYAAGRQITGAQNGLAISGDYLSAASFLGIAGLIMIYGFDGFLYSIGFLVAFLTVMFLLAERMRNSGKYTIADVLSFRLNERPARAAAALGTLAVRSEERRVGKECRCARSTGNERETREAERRAAVPRSSRLRSGSAE